MSTDNDDSITEKRNWARGQPLGGVTAATSYNSMFGSMRTNASLPGGMTGFSSQPGRRDLATEEGDNPTIWDAVNYPYEHELDFETFWIRYQRQAEARAVIDKPTNDTWQDSPEVFDEKFEDAADDEKKSDFGRVVSEFLEGEYTRRTPIHRMNIADKLARLGQYSLLVIGFGDGRELDSPIDGVANDEDPEFDGPEDLNYIATFGEDRVIDMDIEEQMTSSRYRLPKMFTVITEEFNDGTIQDVDGSSYDTEDIHWSRVIHIPEGTLEDDLRGTPALKPVFHELLNIDKIKAASGEGYWRGGYQGMVVSPPKDQHGKLMEFDDDGEGVATQINEFINNFRRVVKTPAEVDSIDSSIGDPTPHLEANYQAMASALDLPKSILTGEDRADTGANEDKEQWNQKIGGRRNNHAEPVIFRPVIQRLIDSGVFPAPEGGGFVVNWLPLEEMTEEQEASLRETKFTNLKTLAPRGDPSLFGTVAELRQLYGWSPEMGGEVDEDELDERDLQVDEEMEGGQQQEEGEDEDEDE